MKSILKVIFINVVILCMLLLGLELFGQVYFYVKNGRFIFQVQQDDAYGHRKILEHHPYIVGRLKKNVSVEHDGTTISTTEHHTRVTHGPAEDDNLIRIAILGGSTTFGTRVSDEDTWPAQLQKKLGNNFSVRNYGAPGYSTAEAIIQLALAVSEWKPHYVVNYHGWNDIRNYHHSDVGGDYFKHGMKQYKNLRIPFYKPTSALGFLPEISTLVRFAQYMKYAARTNSKRGAKKLYTTADPYVDSIYARNLNTLRVLSNGLSAKAVFIPQILNHHYYLTTEKENHGWSRYIENRSMPKLMTHFNQIMGSVCPALDDQCVYLSSVLDVDWQEDDFVDAGHFSRQGGQKFVKKVTAFFLNEEIKKGPSH